MFTMQDYIYEEKEVLSTILKKNDFSTRAEDFADPEPRRESQSEG